MNKLIIIGNGFDLAHELPTSYKDFLLWMINDLFKGVSIENPNVETPLFTVIYSGEQLAVDEIPPIKFNNIDEFLSYIREPESRYRKDLIRCKKWKSIFFLHICNQIKNYRWVDLESEYYKNLLITNSSSADKDWKIKTVINLNKSVDFIKAKLKEYLKKIDYSIEIDEFHVLFEKILAHDPKDNHFLNFNYTPTINNYLSSRFNVTSNYDNNPTFINYLAPNKDGYFDIVQLNYIHGVIIDDKNPIVFGYGDETDKYYKELEDKNENCWLDHMKSFSYMKTYNYRELFNFLNTAKFEVHVMGHSLGISDRLLFNHIFEHKNFDKVQLYYYEWKDEQTGMIENDFYQKTQELSRHFKDDAKHKMRLKVVPFNESVPLPQLKKINV